MVELLWLDDTEMVIKVKVNPPLMRQPSHSVHLTSVNLLQNKTKKILNEIVTPISHHCHYGIYRGERGDILKENNWDFTETPPL